MVVCHDFRVVFTDATWPDPHGFRLWTYAGGRRRWRAHIGRRFSEAGIHVHTHDDRQFRHQLFLFLS